MRSKMGGWIKRDEKGYNMVERWQKEWIVRLMDYCEGNRLLVAKRMAETSKKEITECWSILDQIIPMTNLEREKYRSLGIG